jgi:hypothetical protein
MKKILLLFLIGLSLTSCDFQSLDLEVKVWEQRKFPNTWSSIEITNNEAFALTNVKIVAIPEGSEIEYYYNRDEILANETKEVSIRRFKSPKYGKWPEVDGKKSFNISKIKISANEGSWEGK